MNIKIIAAISKNFALGKDNKLLWKLSDDMKMFKLLTTGNVIIMGRKTFDSMAKALPNRTNIVITRNKFFEEENVVVAKSLQNAIDLAAEYGKDVYIIGGGEIYNQALPLADELIISHVNCEVNADTFFPQILTENWKEYESIDYNKSEKNEFDFTVKKYNRKK